MFRYIIIIIYEVSTVLIVKAAVHSTADLCYAKMAASSSSNEFPFNDDREFELKLGSSFHSKGGPKMAFHTIRCKVEFLAILLFTRFVVRTEERAAVYFVKLNRAKQTLNLKVKAKDNEGLKEKISGTFFLY